MKISKKSNNSWRTTAVAVILMIVIFTTLILLYMKKIDAQEMLSIWGGLGAVSSVFLGVIGKDKQASHTYNKSIGGDNLPPSEEEEPAG